MRIFALAIFLLTACGNAKPCALYTDTCSCANAGCAVVVDTCWCPSECGSNVVCACGGGKFLRCETPK